MSRGCGGKSDLLVCAGLNYARNHEVSWQSLRGVLRKFGNNMANFSMDYIAMPYLSSNIEEGKHHFLLIKIFPPIVRSRILNLKLVRNLTTLGFHYSCIILTTSHLTCSRPNMNRPESSTSIFELGCFLDDVLFSPDAMIRPVVQVKNPEAMTANPPNVD